MPDRNHQREAVAREPRPPRFDHAAALAAMRVAWQLEGAKLFGGEQVPSRQEVLDGALRVLYAGVRLSCSISAAARYFQTTRRAVRDTMKHLGVYEAKGPVDG